MWNYITTDIFDDNSIVIVFCLPCVILSRKRIGYLSSLLSKLNLAVFLPDEWPQVFWERMWLTELILGQFIFPIHISILLLHYIFIICVGLKHLK